jgi:hypothetical protein
MVIDWHEQDVQERKDTRKRLDDYEDSVTSRLDGISLQLAEICVERKIGKWALGGGIAGFLSLAGTVGLKLLNLL